MYLIPIALLRCINTTLHLRAPLHKNINMPVLFTGNILYINIFTISDDSQQTFL